MPVCIILTTNSFGWVNASYVIGLDIVNAHMRRALGALTTWDTFSRAMGNLDVHSTESGRLRGDDASGF